MSTWTLAEHAQEIARAERRRSDGVRTDGSGRPIPIGDRPGAIRPGDLLLFSGSRHVGVLWEDRPPRGVLDSGDAMFHTCWAPPTVERIGASRCASLPVRILRFQ